VVGTFDSPQNFIRIPFQKDFLIHNDDSGKRPRKESIVPLKLPFLSTKQDPNFLRSDINSINFDADGNGPLENGIVFEDSLKKLGPLLPGETEKVYYDGKVYKKIRLNKNKNFNNRDLILLQRDFQRFLSSTLRLRRLGRPINEPISLGLLPVSYYM
jgi:hypothetical protein